VTPLGDDEIEGRERMPSKKAAALDHRVSVVDVVDQDPRAGPKGWKSADRGVNPRELLNVPPLVGESSRRRGGGTGSVAMIRETGGLVFVGPKAWPMGKNAEAEGVAEVERA